MNDQLSQPIDSLAEFLAHALELEVESAERYRDLADVMRTHNNPDTAAFFDKLAGYGDAHAREVEQRASGMSLPYISPWDFKWVTPNAPEAAPLEDAHYQMTPCEALELALLNELRGRDFYRGVAESSSDGTISQAAAEMAEEEDEHVEMLRAWIKREACQQQRMPEDLDPPNMPE